jgi:CTP synthase (UTP-ammonia lyase)
VLATCQIDNLDGSRLSGKLHINIKTDTLAFRAYRQTDIEEKFNCNYELNPVYRKDLESAGLLVSGESDTGSTRIIELPGRRFFLATGFLPQLSSTAEHPHPLITAYLEAAVYQ